MSNTFPAGSTSVTKTMTLLMSRQDRELLEIRQLSVDLVKKKKKGEEPIYPQAETRQIDLVPLLCGGSHTAVSKSGSHLGLVYMRGRQCQLPT